jgi:8-oxo-dGTP pyrophosphatase MutT (NUDIX family)
MTEQPENSFEHDPSVAKFAVSKHAYLDAHPHEAFSLIATSALVLNMTSASAPRILLLQRAASDSNPGKWEPPGGAVDDDDLSILHAAARELWEEAGLRAAYIGGLVGQPHFFARSNGDNICRFNFAVHVENKNGALMSARLNPEEHQQYLWATESEIRAGQVGHVNIEFVREEVKHTILLAFAHL